MAFHTYFPRAPLAHFVKWMWLSRGDHPPHRRERVLPNGTMQLLISLQERALRVYDREKTHQFQSFPASVVVGMQSEYSVIDTAAQASMIGVVFKPGGTSPFFKCPANELQEVHVPLESLWGAGAGVLRDRLLEAPAPADKFQILEQFLIHRAVRALELHPVVAYALSQFQGAAPSKTISQVVDQTGYSARWFIQVFNESVGLTPKLFCRILRFQEVLHSLGDRQEIDWAEIALNCGYFDQAHFIHDFQGFSGISPTAYLAHRSEHVNHVLLS
ncbi:MAG: AraC family transcriptional regulator [Acidobacteriia bacterium]|nr:AraC family transcriptional regulator [Terriglobia bacterium]